MKLLLVGDTHFFDRNIESRVDDYQATCIDKLGQVLSIASKNGVEKIIQVGDFFHHRVYSNEFKSAINDCITLYGIPWELIGGNHVLQYKDPSSILRSDVGPMIAGRIVTRLTVTGGTVGIESYSKLPDQPYEEAEILVMHHFINIDESSFHYRFDKELSFTTPQLRSSFPNARWILAGHDHNSYPISEADGFIIVRPGSVMRTSSAKENLSREVCVALVDTVTEYVEYIPLKVAPYGDVFKVESKSIVKQATAEVGSFVTDIESVQVSAKEDITEYLESLLATVEKNTRDEVRSRLIGKGVL